MNLKFIGTLAAVVGVVSMTQAAEAKNKHWNQDAPGFAATTGGYCQSGATNGQQGRWYNGNNGFQNQFAQFYPNNSWRSNSRNYNFNNGRPWQFNGSNVDQVQARLAAGIQRGIASGRLTTQEAQRLNQMQNRIDQLETRFRSDNRLGSGERARLSSELGRLQDRLRKELMDRQTL